MEKINEMRELFEELEDLYLTKERLINKIKEVQDNYEDIQAIRIIKASQDIIDNLNIKIKEIHLKGEELDKGDVK